MEAEKINDVVVYTSGLICCSVCAPSDMPLEDVITAVNLQNPTGLSHGWTLDEKGEFAGGQPNPTQCNSDPSRMHYLLSC